LKNPRRVVGVVAAWVLCGSAAAAHDFWIEPSRYVLEPGEGVAARLLVGHAWEKESFARKPSHLEAFELHGPGLTQPLVELAGADPAGRARLAEPGVHVLVYRSRPTRLEMEAAAFESYLREEGLEAIVAERARRGESERSGLEAYARCAKALVRTPGAPSKGHDRTFDLPLELTPVSDPFAASSPEGGAAIELRLTSRGIPLAGSLVEAQSLVAGESLTLSARTDAAGRVRLVLPRGGAWLFAAVHMTRAADAAGSPDWESWWASLTLELGSPPP